MLTLLLNKSELPDPVDPNAPEASDVGFLLTPGAPAYDRQPSTRTFAQAVGRVLRATGIRDSVTIESPTRHIDMAMGAVNDAFERIVTAGRWDWRVRWVNFQLETTVFAYDLPPDYAQFAAQPANSNPIRTSPLIYAPFEDLMRRYPQLAFVTSSEMTELGLSELSRVINNIADNTALVGVPEYWSVFGSKLFMFPIPTKTVYEDRGLDWDDDEAWLFCYHPTFKEFTADADVIPLPHNLMMVLHWLATGYFKQALEYPDGPKDEARGEALLVSAVRRHKRIYDAKYAILGDGYDYGR